MMMTSREGNGIKCCLHLDGREKRWKIEPTPFRGGDQGNGVHHYAVNNLRYAPNDKLNICYCQALPLEISVYLTFYGCQTVQFLKLKELDFYFYFWLN